MSTSAITWAIEPNVANARYSMGFDAGDPSQRSGEIAHFIELPAGTYTVKASDSVSGEVGLASGVAVRERTWTVVMLNNQEAY